MADEKQGSIFQKISNTFETSLDAGAMKMRQYIIKARSEIASEEDNAIYRKSIYKDITYSTGSQGYQEKANRMSYQYLNQIAYKNTIVAGIIQTFQNKVAAHSEIAKDQFDDGWMIKLKNEEKALEVLKAELYPDRFQLEEEDEGTSTSDRKDRNRKIAVDHSDELEAGANAMTPEEAETEGDIDDNGELSDQEIDRVARQELQKRTKKKIQAIQELILSCGNLKDRPFESTKWDFDSFLRAIVRDSLTYDQLAVEIISDNKGAVHHWVPVDGGTIRYTTPALKKYKDMDIHQAGYDLLFPEKELKAMEEQRDAIELDEEKLENEDYKFAQVVRGRILRAFTPEEMALGMRNPTTDIYTNGYSISELELLMSIVASHLFTENYNKSYFTQGFSSKGILHIKAPLNRRKLESIRVQWNHMAKGNKNSFQTPIMAGMDEIKWIPLTQNHSDMEFNHWMNYLIKIICMIYQIDPVEIGFGMKDEGGSGGSLSGDNTEEKASMSRAKGLIPLLKFLQKFLNKHIVDRIDPDYELKFVAVSNDDKKNAIKRQSEEVKFKKSVNEIRAEDGLRPIPGADDLILEQTYMMWYEKFHPEGKKLAKELQAQMGSEGVGDQITQHAETDEQNAQGQIEGEEATQQDQEGARNEAVEEGIANVNEQLGPPEIKKSITIEHYFIGDDEK